MTRASLSKLSRRERQIMNIIYRQGKASVNDVLAELADPPSYSAVRATMRLLEEKGHLKHEQDGAKYLYKPTLARDNVRKNALQNLLDTFFEGSATQVVSTLIEDNKMSLSELQHLSKLIEQARQEGK